MAGVIRMSDRELTRLRVMIDLADDRLTVDAAATLMGLGRRGCSRLRRAFSADGPAGLTSRKRGRWGGSGCSMICHGKGEERTAQLISAVVRSGC